MPEPQINITNEQPKKPSIFANPLTWALIVALGWIIFSQWKSCGSQQQYAKQEQALNDALQSKERQITQLKNDSIAIVHHLQDSLDKLHKADSIEVRTGLASANYWKEQNKKLADYIESTKIPMEVGDTTGITAFYDSCKECGRQLKIAFHAVDSANKLVDKTYDLMTYELLIREQNIAIQQHYSDSLQSLFNASTKLTNKVLQDNRPKASLWFGGEGTNSPYYTSFGAVIAFQFKNGSTQISLSGGPILKGGTYGQVRVIQKIKLHK